MAAEKAVDAAAALKMAKTESCLKCHGETVKKDGPSFKSMAESYKSNPDAIDVIYEHITTSNTVKFPDGHKETHKSVEGKDPEQIRNLVRWILTPRN
jgi:cytochrome c